MEHEETMRELSNSELDQVIGGGAPYLGAPRVGTGSCFRWVPWLDQYWACNLLDSYGRPLEQQPSQPAS